MINITDIVDIHSLHFCLLVSDTLTTDRLVVQQRPVLCASTATPPSHFAAPAVDSLLNSPHPSSSLRKPHPPRVHWKLKLNMSKPHSLYCRIHSQLRKRILRTHATQWHWASWAAPQAWMLPTHVWLQRTRQQVLDKQSRQQPCLRSPWRVNLMVRAYHYIAPLVVMQTWQRQTQVMKVYPSNKMIPL